MKKLFLIFTITISAVVNAQCYTSLTQSQNKLLDTYGIDYTGLQTRFIMSTNRLDNISKLEIKNGMTESYTKFNTWNNGQLQIIPDTNFVIETGADYVKNKIFTEESELLNGFLNESHNLLQKVHVDINQDGIESIEIVEFHMTEYKKCTYIFHMVFIEYTNGLWTSFVSDDDDSSLDCPFCVVP